MSPTAAASGFVVFLLSVQVIQSQDDWGVTYTSTEVCAVKGSNVYIFCSYTYPSRIKRRDIKKPFWFTKEKDGEPVDLRTDPEYFGRGVGYACSGKSCTLVITDLRESDSAEYKFRIMTNQDETYTGSPGVTLSVTVLQVEVSRSDSTRSELKCLSSCVLPDRPSYFWYKNGRDIKTGPSLFVLFGSADSYSCAVSGYENHRSPSVYAPKLPSVSVSPSDEIVEGSSVTLTCSSDANPAAYYIWYKDDEDSPKASGQIFNIPDFRAEHSGSYSCEAQNMRGRSSSSVHLTVADKTSMMMRITGWTLVVVIPISLLLVCLWMRKKKALSSTTEPHEPTEAVELDSCPEYDNISNTAAQTEDSEEQEDRV